MFWNNNDNVCDYDIYYISCTYITLYINIYHILLTCCIQCIRWAVSYLFWKCFSFQLRTANYSESICYIDDAVVFINFFDLYSILELFTRRQRNWMIPDSYCWIRNWSEYEENEWNESHHSNHLQVLNLKIRFKWRTFKINLLEYFHQRISICFFLCFASHKFRLQTMIVPQMYRDQNL